MKTINLFFSVSACSLIAMVLIGCGSLKLRDINTASLAPVRKVAVVGLSISQPSSGFGLDAGQTTSTPEADRLYDALVGALAKNNDWMVTERKTLRANTLYQQAYKKTMEGWQNKFGPQQGYKASLAEGIIDAEVVRLMDLGARRQLLKELGVDALVVARVDVSLSGFSVMGIGNKYPEAAVSFSVFNGAAEQAIWYDRISGEPSKESVGKTRFFDDTLVTKYGFDSAKTAFLKIKPENTKTE